ncbi:terpenoid synthase [Aspergillus heteromorphus CBS 117.55]|uniref:Terpenoid synthase n=1 Tax=Aspergillus heteromorphus CBS 117.55 TaxID=1448321 RepID=A0A317WXW4_9EURO|nr:terpenoid synthase [Aspergillus heteromorphus CBS 117.55]PWY90097.1 terpenoid synthase [Aspergillus heteromorphus CBS 117.55]
MDPSTPRPLKHAFDAVTAGAPAREHTTFHFLASSIPGFEASHTLDPQEHKVPWKTAFPASLQSKHWAAAEESARELMQAILAAKAADEQGVLPREWHADTDEASKKEIELVDTAVAAPINMFPAASEERMRIMAKANLLIFMHDDVIESHISDVGNTIIDDALADWNTDASVPDDWRNQLFRSLVREAVASDAQNGRELVEGMLTWVRHTRSKPMRELAFDSWDEYLQYRAGDSAVEFCTAAVKFTCDVKITPEEMKPLEHLHKLWIAHFALTNDLHSYHKEILETQESGTALVNGIAVLQRILRVSAHGARRVLREILNDVEHQIDREYAALQAAGLNEQQERMVRGMIVCLAGNALHSATTYRYARAVPGSERKD